MIPVRRLLGQAVAHLHWSPETFWKATLHELQAAMDVLHEGHEAADDAFKPTPEFIALRDAHAAKESR